MTRGVMGSPVTKATAIRSSKSPIPTPIRRNSASRSFLSRLIKILQLYQTQYARKGVVAKAGKEYNGCNMSSRRILKQLAYGFFYLLVLAAAAVLIYFAFLRSEPGCFNGRIDRGEEGVDCGGPCAAVCLPPDILLLEQIGEPQIFRSAGLASVLTRIQNPNFGVAAKNFSYRIDVYDSSGAVVASQSGSSFIYAGEIKYLANFIALADPARASRAVIVADRFDWLPAGLYSLPDIAFQEKRTEVRDDAVVATGRFLNRDVTDFPRVEILAVFKSGFGLPIGVSKTEVENVRIGESRTFSVFLPPLGTVHPDRTEYFVYARRP